MSKLLLQQLSYFDLLLVIRCDNAYLLGSDAPAFGIQHSSHIFEN